MGAEFKPYCTFSLAIRLINNYRHIITVNSLILILLLCYVGMA